MKAPKYRYALLLAPLGLLVGSLAVATRPAAVARDLTPMPRLTIQDRPEPLPRPRDPGTAWRDLKVKAEPEAKGFTLVISPVFWQGSATHPDKPDASIRVQIDSLEKARPPDHDERTIPLGKVSTERPGWYYDKELRLHYEFQPGKYRVRVSTEGHLITVMLDVPKPVG
jgi:hypothetical protein